MGLRLYKVVSMCTDSMCTHRIILSRFWFSDFVVCGKMCRQEVRHFLCLAHLSFRHLKCWTTRKTCKYFAYPNVVIVCLVCHANSVCYHLCICKVIAVRSARDYSKVQNDLYFQHKTREKFKF